MHVDQYFQYFDYELFVKQTIIQRYLDKMEKFTVFKPNIIFFFQIRTDQYIQYLRQLRLNNACTDEEQKIP